MVRAIAPLVYFDRVDGTHIKINTGSWQLWLAKNSSFRYESFWGCFTACKELRGEEVFWIAYRYFKDQLRRGDLGTSHNLTLDNLIDMAKKLTAGNTTPWGCKNQTKKNQDIYNDGLEPISAGKERETNAIRQWCIFYTHPDGRSEFLGACWEKEQAFSQIQNLLKQAQYCASVGDLYRGTAVNYEVREELVIPIGYTQKRCETNSSDTNATTKEVELLDEVSQLRNQLSELQKQLDRERSLDSNNDASVKFIWN